MLAESPRHRVQPGCRCTRDLGIPGSRISPRPPIEHRGSSQLVWTPRSEQHRGRPGQKPNCYHVDLRDGLLVVYTIHRLRDPLTSGPITFLAGLWPVFNIVSRSLRGSRPPDPPGGLWGGSPAGSEQQIYILFFVAKGLVRFVQAFFMCWIFGPKWPD